MKIALYEKQYNLLLSNLPDDGEINEIDSTPSPSTAPSSTSSSTPTDSTSTSPTGTGTATQTSAPPYPEVGKWESGVTRGAGNQIGVTKWSDIVGSTLTRGKANPLKEQILGTTDMGTYTPSPETIAKQKAEQQKEINFKNNFFIVKIPKTDKWNDNNIVLPKLVDGIKTTYDVWKSPIDPYSIFNSWRGTAWESYIPDSKYLDYILPNGTVRSFMVNGLKYNSYFQLIDQKNYKYGFLWYYNEDNQPFNPYDYIGKDQIPKKYIKVDETWWDKWGQWLLMGGSLLVSLLVPGAAGIWIAIGLDLTAAADILIREGDTIGAGMCAVLAFLPVIGKVLKWGEIPAETVNKLSKEFAPLKTEQEIIGKVNSLPAKEKYILQRLLKEDPKRIASIIDSELSRKLTTKSQASKVIATINKGIKEGVISKKSGYQWYKKLGVRRFGYEIAATGFIIAGGISLKTYFEKIKQKAIKDKIKVDLDMISEADVLAGKIEKMDASGDGSSKIDSVLDSYYEKYQNTQEDLTKFYKISVDVMNAYIKNQNQDLNKVAQMSDNN